MAMQRREFLTSSLAAGAALVSFNLSPRAAAETAPKSADPAPSPVPVSGSQDIFVQPPLPYDLKALAPFLTEEQMTYHFQKHHAGYFKKLNSLVAGKPEAKMSLEELISKADGGVF